MTADSHLPALASSLHLPAPRADLLAAVARVALAASWCVRHPVEPFAERPDRSRLEPLYYRTDDGWEAPLWRLPPAAGASGEPVVLAHALGARPSVLDWRRDSSIVSALHDAGFDVYLLTHRGDRDARPVDRPGPTDFDAIVTGDLPAALDRVRHASGFPRALWLGHGLGGQLLYGWLASGGAADLAAGVAIGAAVRFRAPASHARATQQALRLLPAALRLPLRRLAQMASPLNHNPLSASGLTRDVSGARSRGLLVQGAEGLPIGLVRQIGRWLEVGSLCSRDDRLDYVAALRGLRFPMLGVATRGDPLCAPADAWPALDALAPEAVRRVELDASWGHLDPLVGERAPEQVLPLLVAFLEEHRAGCRVPRGPARA